jgi:hypothetical protein
MNVNEFETGPVEGLLPIAMRGPEFLRLTPGELVLLVQGATSPFYQVLMKLAEGELEKLETAHFKCWKDEAEFQRTGLLAVAARIFLERLGQEVQRQADEFASEIAFVKQKKDSLMIDPEQMIHDQILS